MSTHLVHTDGADIAYDKEGEGPVLLLISGGGGDGDRYRPISRLLAHKNTVVRYDRRCNSRSSGDHDRELDMAQQARDAAAVIRATGAENAYVFGNSAGANIALELAANHPELVSGIIAHEGPTLPMLPDAEDVWLPFIDAVHATFLSQGAGAAMRMFARELVGFDVPLEDRINDYQPQPNADFFLGKEYLAIGRYVPDFDRIRRHGAPIVTAVGKRSADAYYARTAHLQAERLGCECVEFPGNHLAFLLEPEAFATRLGEFTG